MSLHFDIHLVKSHVKLNKRPCQSVEFKGQMPE